MATWLFKCLLRAGISVGPMILLTVPGRTSGRPRTTLVDRFERDGCRILVSTDGGTNSNWVKNLRATGGGILTRGHRQEAVSVVELSPEAAGPLLKKVLGPLLAKLVRGFILRRTLGVSPDASVGEFVAVAQGHPVFELSAPHKLSS
jgi:deazaflavin-dependent oxidoreductase (nitroreductase family)